MPPTGALAMHDHMASMASMPMERAAGWSSAASFLAMWVAMMAVMMLPSVAPVLWRYRRDVAACGGARPWRSTAIATAGYLAVWTGVGVAVLPVHGVLPGITRAAPFAVGVVVLFAGVLQRTGWKRRHLARCRDAPRPCGATAPHDGAWRHGLRLGRDCVVSCAGPMAALLAIGVMDLRAMAVVTAVISAERLAPSGERVARAAGAAAIAAGLALLARASGLG